MSRKDEKIVNTFKIVLNPSTKLKIQLKEEIKKPENKNAFEFTCSAEKSSFSFMIRNLIELFNQFN